MTGEDEIKWVTVTLDFPPDQEAQLEARAKAEGLSVQCYCVHLLYSHLLRDAAGEQQESIKRRLPATLRRNGCRHQHNGRLSHTQAHPGLMARQSSAFGDLIALLFTPVVWLIPASFRKSGN